MSQVRISIGNLVGQVVNRDGMSTHTVALMNSKSYRAGKILFAAIGGGAELTTYGREILEGMGATEFEGRDARFIIGEDRAEEALRLFENRDHIPALFEITPDRDVIAELTKEKIAEFGAIMSPEEASRIKFAYRRTVRQKQAESNGTSERERKDMPTRRLFHLFDMIVDGDIYDKLVAHESIRVLTDPEVASTNGGSRKGKTTNGGAIADNIGLE